MPRVPSLIALTIISAGCASGSGGGGAQGGGNVLLREQLVATNEVDLYMAIQRLRPRWLQPRGQTSTVAPTIVTVFLDGSPRGGVESLRALRPTEVVDVTYLSASEATFRFGTLAGSGGTLAVRTRGRSDD